MNGFTLNEEDLLKKFRKAKDLEIEYLLTQYGTSLKETREMYPQLTEAISRRQLTTTFPTQPLFFTAEETQQMGLGLQEGWMLKLTPTEGNGGFTSSFITPQKWEITENDLYISPAGEQFSKADLEALLGVPTGGLEATPQALKIEDLTEEGRSLYQEYQGAGGELNVSGWLDLREHQQLETEQVFGAVFPQQDIEEVLRYMQENPEGFITDLREIGWNPQTEALVKTLAPDITEEELLGIFGRLPEVEESDWKNALDALRLGFTNLFRYQIPRAFTTLIPQFFTSFFEDPEVMSAVVSEGRTPEMIVVKDPKTGELKWSYTYGGPLIGGYEEVEFPIEVAGPTPIAEPSASISEIGRWAENAGKVFQEKYEEGKAEQLQWLIAHPELQPPAEWEGGVIEKIKEDPGILKNPAYWAYIAAESAAFTTAFMGTSLIVGTVTQNPYLGLMAGWALTTPVMVEDLYEDLLASGASQDQALRLALPIGAVINSVEIMGDLPFLRAVSPVFARAFSQNVKTQLVNMTWRQLVAKGLRTFTDIEIAETIEEIVQEAIQNATVATIDENRDILANIPEVTVRTLIATLPLAVIGGGTHTAHLYNYMSSSQRTQINETIEKLTQNGVPRDQAELVAIGQVLETEEGQEALSKAVEEVSALPEIQRQAQTAINQLQENNPDLVMPAGNLGVKDPSKITDPIATSPEALFTLPSNEEIKKGLLIPNWIRTVLKKTEHIPVIGKVQRAVLGWRSTLDLENDTTEAVVGRAAVVYGAITRMGVNTGKVLVGTLRSILANPVRYFGFNQTGYSAKMAGRLLPDYKGEANAGTLEDVFTHPERYDWTRMDKGLDYVTRFNRIQEVIFALLQKEGVALNLVNEAWMHRVVTARTAEGEVIEARGRPGRTGRAVGATPSYEKPRTFKTMAEGIQASIEYEPNPEVSIGSYIEEAYKKIAGERVTADLQAFGVTPSERLLERFPEVVERAERTKEELADAARLHELVLRAKRGEKLTEQTLRAMERRFPDLGRRLRTLVKTGSATEKQLRLVLKQNERLIGELRAQLARAKAVKPGVAKVEVTRIETADIEPHVEAKYGKLPGEESEAVTKVVEVGLIVEGELETDAIELALRALSPENAAIEIEAIEATIGDQLGDLIETYRYESWEEGQALERYLDSLLEVTQRHRQALGLPRTADLTIEPLTGKPTRVAKPEPLVVPDEVKLREAFKLMEYEDRLAFRNTMVSQLQEIGEGVASQQEELEGVEEFLRTDLVASYKAEITITTRKGLKQTKRVALTDVLKGGEMPETLTPRNAQILLMGRDLKPGAFDKAGNVRWEYIIDELADHFHMEEQELVNKIESILDTKERAKDLKWMIDNINARAEGVKRMLSTLSDVESAPETVEAEVVEPLPEAIPMPEAEVAPEWLEAAQKLEAAGEKIAADLQGEISRLETILMEKGANITEIQIRATRDKLSDTQYLERLREFVGRVAPKLVEAVPEAALEATDEERWTAMSIPERVDAAKSVGLEGKVGSKEWADLTAGERDALKFVREEAAPYRALPEVTTVAMTLEQFKETLNKVTAETKETLIDLRGWLKEQRFLRKTRAISAYARVADDRLFAEQEADYKRIKDQLDVLEAVKKNPEEYYPRLPTEFPNLYELLLDRGRDLNIIPRIGRAAPGMPEAGLQVDMFGYQTPVTPKGKGKTTQISLDDYKKLVETYEEEGRPMPYMRVKPKIEGISELSDDTDFQQEIFSTPEAITPEQKKAEFDKLAGEAKTLMELRKAPYWQARAERAAKMEIVRQPGIGEGYLTMPFAGGRIFNQDFIDSCNKFFGREPGSSVLSFTSDAASILRITKAALDFSAMAIQGLPSFGLAHAYLLTNPRIGLKLMGGWYKALGLSTAAFFRGDVFYSYVEKNQDAILQRINGFAGTSRAIDYFDVLKAKHGLGRLSAWIFEKMPGQPFERAELAFYSAGEIVRTEMWKALSPKAIKQGKGFELARNLDLITGISDSQAAGVPLTIRQLESSFMWFAPNYTRACLSVLADVFRGGYTGAQARRALGGLLGAGVAYYVGIQFAMAMLSGKDEDDTWRTIMEGLCVDEDPITGEVTWRPTSRLMTIKVGNYNFGIGGFWYGLVRLAGNIGDCINEIGNKERIDLIKILEHGSINRDNPFVYWWYSRSSPLVGTGLELLNGRDFLGYPIETPAQYLEYLLSRFEPIWMEQGLNWMVPGLVRDYEIPEDEARAAVPIFELFGWRTFPESSWVKFYDKVKDYIKQLPFDELDPKQVDAWKEGKLGWAELTKRQKQDLLQRYPELAELYDMAQEDSKVRDSGVWKTYTDRMDEERAIYYDRIDEYTRRLLNGEIDTREYRDLCSEAGQNYGAIMEAIERDPTYAEIYEYFDEKEAEGSKYEFRWDLAYADYSSKIRFAEDPDMYLPNGDYNWDERDSRVAEFIDKWGVDLYNEILDYINTEREVKGLNPVWLRKGQDSENLSREYWNLPYQPISQMTEEDYNEGNIPAEQYALWKQYQNLPEPEKEGFLELHPELTKDWRAEYRKNNPEEDAMLALWGYSGKIQSMEAYNLLRQWGKELGIPLSQMGLGLPAESLMPAYFDYSELLTQYSANSAESKLWKLQHPEFTNWAMEQWGWEGTEDYKGMEYYQLQVKWREREIEYNAIEGDIARQEFLQANPEFWTARLTMRAMDTEFPEDLIPEYVEWYQSEFENYEDDWWLMEHEDFYNTMYDLEIWTEPRDFSKVPTREVWSLYQQYINLPTGTPRLDFRAKHLGLDAWLVLKFDYKPIQDRGNPEAEKTPWEEAAEVEEFQELFK